MTPLGFNTAAVPEAAAMFPLSAATPPASENAGAATAAFGDLLAASFAQAGLLEDAVVAAGAGSAANPVSLADVWFAGLNVDLQALNAGLEVEEAGLPVDAASAAGVPADVADQAGEADGVDDEQAALMALAMYMPVPDAWPEGHALQVRDDAAACSAHPSGCAGDSYVGPAPSGLPGEPEDLASQVNPMNAPAQTPRGDLAPAASVNSAEPLVDPKAAAIVDTGVMDGTAVGQAFSGLPGEPEGIAPHAGIVGIAPRAGSVGIAPHAGIVGIAALTPRADAGAAAQAPQLPDVQQPEVSAAPTPVQESSAEELPKEQLLKTLESAPAMQQTGRTRESVVAKLAEMSGLGVSGEAVARPVPGTNLGTDSEPQSQTQDGSTQDGFALGVKESATPARSADGAAVTPVFSVAAPVASPARAVVVEGATLPPAPPAATVPGPENVGRLIESMRVQMRQGVQEATVRLNPEHLGEVTISVRVERGAVSAVVNAETPAVQQWLESQEDRLRSGLSDQGLQLAKFIVQRDGSQQHREQPQQQKPPARDRQQRDGTPIRFEVLV